MAEVGCDVGVAVHAGLDFQLALPSHLPLEPFQLQPWQLLHSLCKTGHPVNAKALGHFWQSIDAVVVWVLACGVGFAVGKFGVAVEVTVGVAV
jgi:hypothetical protein